MPEAKQTHASASSASSSAYAVDAVCSYLSHLTNWGEFPTEITIPTAWEPSGFDDCLPEDQHTLGRCASPYDDEEPIEELDRPSKHNMTTGYFLERLVPEFKPLRTSMQSIDEKIAEICKSESVKEDELSYKATRFNKVVASGAELESRFQSMSATSLSKPPSQSAWKWKKDALNWSQDARYECRLWTPVLDNPTKASAMLKRRADPTSRASQVSTVSPQELDTRSIVY